MTLKGRNALCNGMFQAKSGHISKTIQPRLLITNRSGIRPFRWHKNHQPWMIFNLGWPSRSVTTSTVSPTLATAGLLVWHKSQEKYAAKARDITDAIDAKVPRREDASARSSWMLGASHTLTQFLSDNAITSFIKAH